MNDFKKFLPYVKNERKSYILAFIGSIFRFLIPLSIPLILKYIFDDILGNPGISDAEKIEHLYWIAGIVIAVFVLIRTPMEYLRQFYVHKANNNIIKALRKDAFSKIHDLDAAYFTENRSGEIGVRFFDDIERVKNFLGTVFVNIWVELMVLVAVIGIMASLHWQLTLLSILLVSFQFFIGFYLSKKIKLSLSDMMSYRSRLSGFLFERIQGAFTAKLFATEKKDKANFLEQLDEYETLTDRQAHLNARILTIINNLSDLTPFVIVVIASFLVIKGELTIGALIAFFAYVDRMKGPVASLVESFPILAEGMVSIHRIQAFFGIVPSVVEKPNAQKFTGLQTAIEFKNVHFGYNAETKTINNISLKIEKGKTYAFAGESGGGKSSILKALLRLYDITDGELLVDGQKISDLSLQDLRYQMGVVSQDVFLYSTSIYENILMAKPESSEEEVFEAARKAFAHDFIQGLPEGYQTEVGERGVKLSGGQKQRIALARVFLKNPSLFILDEATSALDNESERLVQESIEKIQHDKTVLLVAHRLSSVRKADTIFMIRKGQIVESGNHDELMKKQGYYHSLYIAQETN